MPTRHWQSRTALLAAVVLAASVAGVGGAPVHGATTSAAPAAGTLDPAVLDLGLIYHYKRGSGQIRYTNANAVPVSITGIQITDQFERWAVTTESCTAAPIPAGGSCLATISFYASVSARFFTDTATITFVDGSTSGAIGSLVARVAPRPSAETWSAPLPVPGSGTNPGNGFARTASSSAEYLHVLFTGDTVSGVPVADHGPYRLISYTRSKTDGDTWRPPVRLNPTSRHGTDPTLAASGSVVYAAWVGLAQASVTGSGPRVLYVRVNATNGIGTWRAAIRLTSSVGRVMGPRSAAAGSYAYIAYTDGNTGSVKVAVSRDKGATWSTRTLGTTTRGAAGSRDGGVSVAAYGAQILVSWISSSTGTVKVRASRSGGSTWAATLTVGAGADAGTATSASIHGDAGAAAWIDGTSIRYAATRSGKHITDDAWAPSTIDSDYMPHAYLAIRSVSAAVRSVGHVSFAFEACYTTCDPASADYRSDIVWREAIYLSSRVVIGSGGSVASVARPSVVYATSTLRYVLTTTRDAAGGKERLVLNSGIGLP